MEHYRQRLIPSNADYIKYYPLSQSITETPEIKFTHKWTIKKFPILRTDIEAVTSPMFSPPSSKDKWYIKLRPKNIDTNTGFEYLGFHLFLHYTDTRKKRQIRAKYVISVLDTDGKKQFTSECSNAEGRIFEAGGIGYGFNMLAPREYILNSENNILGDEHSLQVLCEITTYGEITSQLLPTLTSLYSKNEIDTGCLVSDLKNEKEIVDDTDTVIETIDGVRIKVHRFMLKARSSVFRAMFNNEMKEKENNVIIIRDFDSSVIKEMINFIYTDEVENICNTARDLLVAADKYDIPKLKKICEQYLAENAVEVDSSGILLTISDSCECPRLKETVLQFICANYCEVSKSDGWQQHVGKRPHLYKEAFETLLKKRRKN